MDYYKKQFNSHAVPAAGTDTTIERGQKKKSTKEAVTSGHRSASGSRSRTGDETKKKQNPDAGKQDERKKAGFFAKLFQK